jgi:hypothetical protein
MWKKLAVVAALMSLIGCSNGNQMKIVNGAGAGFILNFRATLYPVSSGETIMIKDIPNGEYVGIATYEIPAGLTMGLLPTIPSLTFKRDNSNWTLFFTALIPPGPGTPPTPGTTINYYLNATSNDGTNITSP